MTDCTATGTIKLDDEPIAVICNLAPHDGPEHHDVVHGDWIAIHLGPGDEISYRSGPVVLSDRPDGEWVSIDWDDE